MWKQHVPNWIPLAGLVTGNMSTPFLTRAIELLIVGAISSVATLRVLESDVTALKANSVTKVEFDMHKAQNAEFRERIARERIEEDRKWDERISRLESCFISRTCGLKSQR